jgi:regulator of PEP synthase PpsR (kinase-PPPase family)
MLQIRTERLKSLGLSEEAKYASLPRILEELVYAEHVMKSLGCHKIDVSNKAIEETANIIIQTYITMA